MVRYGVDSLLLFLMSISAEQVVAQYPPKFTRGAQLGFYLALLVGTLLWGGTADVIGRKWAFNFSLLISAVFAITAGAAPNYAVWATLLQFRRLDLAETWFLIQRFSWSTSLLTSNGF